VNVPVWTECFIPSGNTVMILANVRVGLLLSKANESIAVLENVGGSAIGPIGSPKPPNPVLLSAIVTHKKIVLLVLVEVCELVEFAFDHIKKLPRIHSVTLRDLRDLEQSLLAKVIKVPVIVVLLRRVRHRGDSERKV